MTRELVYIEIIPISIPLIDIQRNKIERERERESERER